jgi:RimJ/RimL family protein N-acetyltransferase
MQLMQRVGFRQEAHHIRSYPFRGRMVDDIVFALLAEEWPPFPREAYE